MKVLILVLLGLAGLLVLLDCWFRNGEKPPISCQENDDKKTTSRSFFRASSSLRRQLATASPFHFYLYAFQEFGTTATQWATQYPNFLRVTTAQTEFHLPAAGGKVSHILYIQDYITHPLGSASSNRLPEVLWSGAVHGDERVGPASVMEAAHLLLQAASCEAQLTSQCREQLLHIYGVDDEQRVWLARLVSTRRIVVIPTANALGYYENVREENNVDPNRDFPFDLLNDFCMQSVAREH
jgi:hypothetical protein